MLTFTEAQVLAWITPILWPFLRILALFTSLPMIAQRSVPARIRVGLAFLIAFCAQATIPAIPPIALDSAAGFMAVLQQVLIGISLGFAVRIVITGVELAGEVIGLQMGLNFAAFFNPMTAGEETSLSQFFGIAVSWLFIVMGGHLMLDRGGRAELRRLSGLERALRLSATRNAGARRSSAWACGSRCPWWACCSSPTSCSASSRASPSR